MAALSRMQAEALLRAARTGRPLYDDLRPAYTRLDPLVAMLRRRGFTGLMHAAGRPGEGVLWFERGRVHSGWLLVPEAREVAMQRDDPLAALRALWADDEAVVAVHAATPPPLGDGAEGTKATAGAPVGPPAVRARVVPLRAAVSPTADPLLAGVPWDRILPEAVARVRRHRGSPLAQQLEEAANLALAPDASLQGHALRGPVQVEKGAAALQAVAEGVKRVAGAAFTERLFWTLARDFACEDAVKHLLEPLIMGGG